MDNSEKKVEMNSQDDAGAAGDGANQIETSNSSKTTEAGGKTTQKVAMQMTDE